MVDGPLVNGFEVQQTLHGYGEGHRLLAGSVSLPPRDVRTMLILSDSSGGGAKLPAEGYLTGYPLAESAKYVLGRTWPAPEMRRPGCVWTHSVIIDFADIAALRSASKILRLFRRPDVGLRETYERSLTVVDAIPPEPGDFNPDIAHGLVSALYGSPNSKIVGGLDAGLNEDVVLRTWMQQWPRLRRSFRFCTFTAADRSTTSDPFDLQLVSSAASIPRLRVANVVSPGETSRAPELAPLVEDLLDPDVDGLRQFLRESGVELSEGRSAMRPLCTVFGFVRGRTTDAEAALAALDQLDRSRASTARRRVVGRLAQDIEAADAPSFRMVIDEIRTDEGFDESLATRVGAELWRRQPASFVGALVEPDFLSPATNAALARMDMGELMLGISRDPETAPEIAKHRRDLLVTEEFWKIPGIDIERTVTSCEDRSERVVSSLMSSYASVQPSTIRQFQARTIIGALEKVGRELGRDRVEPWLQVLRDHTQDLIGALRNRELKFAPSMSRLAHALDPDDVFCDERGDPWFDALSEMVGELTAEEDAYLCAFLLARGLGRQSSDPAALMRLSLGKVHRALAGGQMPPDGWRMLRNQLPFVMPWQEWDRCWRVRSAVGEKFVDRNLGTLDFVNVVDDPELWRQLASDASHVWGGWKYLKQVQRRLEADGTSDPRGQKLAALRHIL
jgi:GTPase-associated protein 1, N-terminal domain type 1